jgi:hypothetical protein
MNPDAVDTANYSAVQSTADYSRPATAPDTSATQAPNSGENSSLKTQSEPQPPQPQQIYFFDPNLGQYVNVLA